MKILFIGCVESSKLLLEGLMECDAEIVGVITKKSSDFNADFFDLSEVCRQHGLDFIYVNNINEEVSVNYIRGKEPDLIYCFGWSQLISKSIIDIPTKGIIGFHPAELPYNRGRHPIIWTLALGLDRTASTFFYITEGADEGDIVSQKVIPVAFEDTAGTLYDKIMKEAVMQVKEFTKQFGSNTVIPVKQDNSKANYWRKRTVRDGEIDWRMSTIGIYNLVRALTKPYIGAHFIHNEHMYKVWSVKIIKCSDFKNMEYGKILKVNDDGSFLIKAGDGVLLVDKCDLIQLKEGEYM